jgi:hypothetical protein
MVRIAMKVLGKKEAPKMKLAIQDANQGGGDDSP